MMEISVDTRAFSEVPPDEHVRIEPPNPSALVVGDAMEIRRSSDGTEILTAQASSATEIPLVDKTLDDVLSKCERDLRNNPDSPRFRLNLGLALLNRGKRTEGVGALRAVLEADPTNFIALNALAVALFNEGYLDEAALLYRRTIERYPESATASIGLASIALRRSDFIDAATHLEMAIAADRTQVTAHILLALVALKLAKPQRSISVLRNALRDNVKSAELHQMLAISYWVMGDLKRAERAFHAALAVNPNLASAVHGLALILIHQKRIDDSLMLLSSRLEREPTDAQSRSLISDSYVSAGRYKQARVHLQRLLEAGQWSAAPKELARINNNIGYCFAMEQRVTEAEDRLLTSIKTDPLFSPRPYENLARVYLVKDRIKDALRTLDAALAAKFETSDLRFLRQFCLVKLGRYTEAKEELRILVAQDGAPSVAYAVLGWLLVEWTDDPDSAIAVLKKGLDRWSRDPLILNNLAYAHLTRGESAAARMVLDLLPSDFGPEPFTVATRGMLSLIEGDIEGGEELYSEAEKLASHRGERALSSLLRQKRLLEVARAYIRLGDPVKAIDALHKGAQIDTLDQPYPFYRQITHLLNDLEGQKGILRQTH